MVCEVHAFTLDCLDLIKEFPQQLLWPLFLMSLMANHVPFGKSIRLSPQIQGQLVLKE